MILNASKKLETLRLQLIPCTLDELLIGASDIKRLAAKKGYGLESSASYDKRMHKAVFRAKAKLIEETPDLWLFCTAWLMIEKETRLLIGDLGFKGFRDSSGEVEIGYGLYPPYRNRGYMTEAVNALCRYAFSQGEHPIDRVMATTEAGNMASHRVLQKNHFRRAGYLDGYMCWRKYK